jgi:hypothetical protein
MRMVSDPRTANPSGSCSAGWPGWNDEKLSGICAAVYRLGREAEAARPQVPGPPPHTTLLRSESGVLIRRIWLPTRPRLGNRVTGGVLHRMHRTGPSQLLATAIRTYLHALNLYHRQHPGSRLDQLEPRYNPGEIWGPRSRPN